MRILVTGAKGQLGRDVIKVLEARNIECLGTDIDDFDITNTNQTFEIIRNYQPDTVVHCAAYTAVDKAEDEVELCRKINVNGSKNIAEICSEINAKMIYISTDYVFPGEGDDPYEVDSITSPLSIYGETKLKGEELVREQVKKHFIVRISWAFGNNGNNFVKTMLRLGKDHDEVNVVEDQIGSPTYTADLALLLCDMLLTDNYGTYHATNEGFCSFAEFAEEIFKLANYNTKVNFIPTSQYPTKATRPLNSRLSKKSLDVACFARLPEWKDALRRYLEDIELNDKVRVK